MHMTLTFIVPFTKKVRLVYAALWHCVCDIGWLWWFGSS